jgi:hypothetical protein
LKKIQVWKHGTIIIGITIKTVNSTSEQKWFGLVAELVEQVKSMNFDPLTIVD